jgi:serine/threonine protein kinase
VCYIVFEYICGGELFDFVTRPPALPASSVRAIFAQLLQGLIYVHSKGIAHRDLKLENVLLDENFNIKIADFGTAGFFSKRGNLRTLIGTPGYMAPEISTGKKYKGVEADIFSLGCILFMLNTRMPVTEGNCDAEDPVYTHLWN